MLARVGIKTVGWRPPLSQYKNFSNFVKILRPPPAPPQKKPQFALPKYPEILRVGGQCLTVQNVKASLEDYLPKGQVLLLREMIDIRFIFFLCEKAFRGISSFSALLRH